MQPLIQKLESFYVEPTFPDWEIATPPFLVAFDSEMVKGARNDGKNKRTRNDDKDGWPHLSSFAFFIRVYSCTTFVLIRVLHSRTFAYHIHRSY